MAISCKNGHNQLRQVVHISIAQKSTWHIGFEVITWQRITTTLRGGDRTLICNKIIRKQKCSCNNRQCKTQWPLIPLTLYTLMSVWHNSWPKAVLTLSTEHIFPSLLSTYVVVSAMVKLVALHIMWLYLVLKHLKLRQVDISIITILMK